MKKIIAKGGKTKLFQTVFWENTRSIKFQVPEKATTGKIVRDRKISYEIICATALKAPKKAYLELLAQLANKTP